MAASTALSVKPRSKSCSRTMRRRNASQSFSRMFSFMKYLTVRAARKPDSGLSK